MVYTDYFVRGTEPLDTCAFHAMQYVPYPEPTFAESALEGLAPLSIESALPDPAPVAAPLPMEPAPVSPRRVPDLRAAPPEPKPEPAAVAVPAGENPSVGASSTGAARSTARSVGTIVSLSSESYPAAKLAAPTVHAHFAKHLGAARARGRDPIAALPTPEVIERMINATFWASLRREEGYIPKISMAFLPPEQTEHPMMLEQPLPLAPAALTKVAAIVEHAGIHLGVWETNGELCIWGTAHNIPTFCFVLEVVEPGLIVIKHHRGEQSGKYVNVAVLEGDQIKIVDESASSLPDCPELVTSLLGFDSPASWVDSVNVLVQLAVSMRSHGRGGSLLIVPPDSDAWRESIVHPIPVRRVAAISRAVDADEGNGSGTAGRGVEGRAARDRGGDCGTDGGRRSRNHHGELRTARVRREDSAEARLGAGGRPHRHRADRRWRADGVERRAAWRHEAFICGAVRPRPTQRDCAGGLAG